ncbi:hypothetical protein EXU85_09295 [Spirosoma sp. KCTC 42546]|uniref:hypothetical protein n=1 Tax=Spirosoma sp. KCTC 42546 TaxID=2520506 RepID=UPI00115C31A1|nr:hypothetical protein [Spirosoma sp. KCTC 42546]QDK78789.1 hypothetical protein EXU85_09295 [Spirosoma sp. KCTC 42546]
MFLLGPFLARYWILSVSVMLLMRCNKADLKASSATDPAHLQVNTVIHRHLVEDGHVSHFIRAYVKDESGKSVADPAIQITVNGQPLRLNGGSTNYYGAFPYYERATGSEADIQGGTTYTFTVVLRDGTEYPIGSIDTQPDLTPDQLPLPMSHPRNQPLLLRWKAIGESNYFSALWKRYQGESSQSELLVSKINETRDKWGHIIQEEGSGDQADYITLNVSTGSGSSTIPDTYFDGPQRTFNALSLMLTSTKTVDVIGPFRKGSTLSSERTQLYRVNVVD